MSHQSSTGNRHNDILRKRKGQSLVEFIYSAAKQNIPIDTVKNSSMWHRGYPVCLFHIIIIVMKIAQLQLHINYISIYPALTREKRYSL